ncbi:MULTISPECIES: HDOD domain-containing protein [Marinobacter]|uniref:HDOD domain-containing protein n=1 Tax=Marinobacter xiaoshiensis TaxID=3073652 RepID=A0ABU2HL34_9GAMM|nr:MULTISPECIES: HDOD domain-containing protein [unclassified Marinobacter]MBK1872806.1 HDOD domain-containing protein [Marinobacter sp. 1-3A]MBK1886881.1 HDOD domain-containing protein [Marinobacter sp. DY40_1A1]MDS1311779.1 HDOD domain-containing protein [Marinobacter sp. F60267]
MALAARLERFFNQQGIAYQERPIGRASSLDEAVSALGESRKNVIKATLLIDISGIVMAVHKFDSALDTEALHQLTGRHLQPLTAQQTMRLFGDCDPGFTPPIGNAYELPVLLDEGISQAEQVLFSSGTDHSMVELDGRSLRLAMAGSREGNLAIRGPGNNGGRDALTLAEVASKLKKLYRLPPMPALALRILRLTSNTEATARELAELIEFDPSLTAQVMRYARSALFNYPGQINSVQDAVTRVLGFDRVAHIALGIASVRAFDVPKAGILGMDSFWRHSLYCAFVSQRMAPRCGADKGLAYLCGLLHNFGLLLVGHLFPAEFKELNKLREANPEASMQSLEQQVFGQGGEQEIISVGHGAIGGILHRLWELPDPVVKAAGVHQQPGYQGEHQNYVMMVQLANALLKERGIGDEFNSDDIPALLDGLGLEPGFVDELNVEIDQVAPELDALASSLNT